jgi:myo-inositol-1(or 4)-monophosphatase
MNEESLLPVYLSTARLAARQAGAVILRQIGRPVEVREKGPRDLVTDTDHAAQAAALAVIRARHADHAILAEEDPAGHKVTDGRWEIPPGVVWVVDPLDGTTNFTTALPFSCVSVGVSIDGDPVVGAIYDPYRDELFTAMRGHGAHVNGRPLPLLATVDLRRAVIGVDWARAPHVRQRALATLAALAPHCHTARALGSAALAQAYVASGRVHLYFNFGLQPWDVGAGAAMILEVGGILRQPGGEAWRLGEPALLAGHPALLDEAQPFVSAACE